MVIQGEVVLREEVVMSSLLLGIGTVDQAEVQHAEAGDLVVIHHAGVDDAPGPEHHRRRDWTEVGARQ